MDDIPINAQFLHKYIILFMRGFFYYKNLGFISGLKGDTFSYHFYICKSTSMTRVVVSQIKRMH